MQPGWPYREFDGSIAICASFVEANSQSICYLIRYIYTRYLVMLYTCYQVYMRSMSRNCHRVCYIHVIDNAIMYMLSGYARYTLSGYAID